MSHTLLAGVDTAGIVQCGLVAESVSYAELQRMLRFIRNRGYETHWQVGGILHLGAKLDAADTEPTAPATQQLSFALA